MKNQQKKNKNNKKQCTMPSSNLILPWVGKIYEFYSRWLLDATHAIYLTTRTHHFCKAKAYHSKVKPDAATLKLEVTRCWNAYICHQPRPSNWKIDKCIKYLMSHPIPTLEKKDLDFLASELDEWKGIQQLINDSHEREEDWIIHHSWSSNIPFFRLYHTLVEDGICSAFGKAY